MCWEPASATVGSSERCALCGWELTSGFRLGQANDQALADSAHALRNRQLAWDLSAVRLASRVAGPTEEAARGRINAFARVEGAVWPAPDEIDDTPELDHTVALGTFFDRLRRTEAHDRLSFLEVAPTGFTLWRATDSRPEVAVVWSRAWHQVSARLSADDDVRLFQLAGGIGQRPAVDRREWDELVGEALRQVGSLVVGPLVLIAPPQRWVLLDRVAAAVRGGLAPMVELRVVVTQADLDNLAKAAMAAVPAPEAYDVLLARRNGSGLTVVRHELFPPDIVEPGDVRVAEVVVYGASAGGKVLVPVVVRSDVAPERATGVSTTVLTLGPNERAVLRWRQDGPGTLHLTHPDAAAAGQSWERFADDLSDLLSEAADRELVDIVVTLERGGSPDVVHRRKLDAATLIAALKHSGSDGSRSIHCGLITYSDNQPQRRAAIDVKPLAPLDTALRQVNAVQHSRIWDDRHAPLEDALNAATGVAWRPGSHRVVVMIAGRPPHPPGDMRHVPGAASKRDVRNLAATLRDRSGAKLMPVVGPVSWNVAGAPGRASLAWAEQTWPALADAGPFDGIEACLTELRSRFEPAPSVTLRLALAEPLAPGRLPINEG